MARELIDELADGAWRLFTDDAEKWQLYSEDEHVAAGLARARPREAAGLAALLRDHAVLVLQPDCVAGGLAQRALSIVRREGFEPVHWRRVRIDPPVTAAIWHYQSSSSTPASLELADAICSRDDSIVVLLRDVSAVREGPASLRLTALKGPSDTTRRQPHQLRATLGSPTKLVVLVHTSDEPLDMVRELAILVPEALADFYAAMGAAASPATRSALEEAVAELEARALAHDLDLEASSARLRSELVRRVEDSDVPGGMGATAGDLLERLDRARAGAEPLDWHIFARGLEELGADPLSWDALVVATDLVEHDLPGVERLLAGGRRP
ncbi:nucleoside-diphosphate kinase [Cellulomonas timonensis]|uniref:nucleoside-diphosphate kinase n=1 Tax=Cellulomonas timonensis TaxID=1689271 RepID=UPI0008336CBB|nr:nucleoside-diphosphate kinase [Cellulomonas timonensis]